MAGDDQRAEKSIVDIPYSVLLSIYQSLDADKGWEKLAAETGYTFDKIRLLELEGTRSQGSPGRSLLWELGSRNTTVRQLYGRLSTLGRYREMKILEDYVLNPSSQSLSDNGLKGLPDVPVDASNSLKGLKPPSSKKTNSSNSNNSCVHSNSFNFNQQPVSNTDTHLSSDKHYPGKQMPFFSPSATPSHSSSGKSSEAPQTPPSSIVAPVMKPTNPGPPGIPGPSNVNLVQNMLRQMPGGVSGSDSSSSSSPSSPSSNSGHAQASAFASSPSSSSSDNSLSSRISSLPGLESTFDVQMAFMGSACFSYSEVVQATNNFSEQNKLGEGAFGKVYFGVLRKNKCAVKKMAEVNGQETVVERSTQIKRELTSLLKFRHENIVTLYGYAVDGESLCLIYQYMPNGSLEDRLMCMKNTAPLVWSQRLNILLGACQGLNFLHTMGEQALIHGDIKSANILLDKHMEAKIGDLGQAQQANSRESGSSTSRFTHITRAQATTKLYGTRAYQPREVQTGSRPSTKSDVFSMGVVLLEVFSGEKAFDERREGEQFLADYFRSLKEENGDDACLSKLDRRGGECPREVCLAILNIADVCTSLPKRRRPDSSQLLQKMMEACDLFAQKTGIKPAGMDSLPGSEHSCHLSHLSSPGASMPNLTAAPPAHPHPQLSPQHNTPPPPAKPSNNFSVNVNQDRPAEKHYAMHLRHEGKPNNCTLDNIHSSPTSRPGSSTTYRQNSQSPPSYDRSPIDYFEKGQPLPTAFRLQQAYDSRDEMDRRRISRLSQEVTSQAYTEVLPQPDPAKLAALEQFDHENMSGSSEEKECNSFRSDPRKLAALKQFDDRVSHVQLQEEVVHTQHQALENNLASDPQKLARLRLFDECNMKTVDTPKRQEEQMPASDPRKLAALTRFDAENSEPQPASYPSYAADTDPRKLAALTKFDAENLAQPPSCVVNQSTNPKAIQNTREGNCTRDPFPVSRLDYVVSSQKEALEACMSTGQLPVTLQPVSLSACRTSQSPLPVASVPDPGQEESKLSPGETHISSQGPAPSSLPSNETLLLVRNNFFDMYSKALEEMDDDNFEEENEDTENEDVEENNVYTQALPASGPGDACPSVQGQVGEDRMDAHCHPVPSEQDETVLNYFRQRQQYYEKTFNKNHLSQCL